MAKKNQRYKQSSAEKHRLEMTVNKKRCRNSQDNRNNECMQNINQIKRQKDSFSFIENNGQSSINNTYHNISTQSILQNQTQFKSVLQQYQNSHINQTQQQTNQKLINNNRLRDKQKQFYKGETIKIRAEAVFANYVNKPLKKKSQSLNKDGSEIIVKKVTRSKSHAQQQRIREQNAKIVKRIMQQKPTISTAKQLKDHQKNKQIKKRLTKYNTYDQTVGNYKQSEYLENDLLLNQPHYQYYQVEKRHKIYEKINEKNLPVYYQNEINTKKLKEKRKFLKQYQKSVSRIKNDSIDKHKRFAFQNSLRVSNKKNIYIERIRTQPIIFQKNSQQTSKDNKKGPLSKYENGQNLPKIQVIAKDAIPQTKNRKFKPSYNYHHSRSTSLHDLEHQKIKKLHPQNIESKYNTTSTMLINPIIIQTDKSSNKSLMSYKYSISKQKNIKLAEIKIKLSGLLVNLSFYRLKQAYQIKCHLISIDETQIKEKKIKKSKKKLSHSILPSINQKKIIKQEQQQKKIELQKQKQQSDKYKNSEIKDLQTIQIQRPLWCSKQDPLPPNRLWLPRQNIVSDIKKSSKIYTPVAQSNHYKRQKLYSPISNKSQNNYYQQNKFTKSTKSKKSNNDSIYSSNTKLKSPQKQTHYNFLAYISKYINQRQAIIKSLQLKQIEGKHIFQYFDYDYQQISKQCFQLKLNQSYRHPQQQEDCSQKYLYLKLVLNYKAKDNFYKINNLHEQQQQFKSISNRSYNIGVSQAKGGQVTDCNKDESITEKADQECQDNSDQQ